MKLTEKILNYLQENRVDFKEIDHLPTPTCEESAAARGESMDIGGKTLLLKGKKGFSLFVISASLQADNNKMRKILSSQKLRFATKDELWDLAGVEKGALPPFGRPILDYELYVDESIKQNERIAFNAGVLTKSIIISTQDYFRLVDATLCKFSK